jgi:hypothetical protein
MPIINGKSYPLNLDFDYWLHQQENYDVSGEAYLLAQKVWEHFQPVSKDSNDVLLHNT